MAGNGKCLQPAHSTIRVESSTMVVLKTGQSSLVILLPKEVSSANSKLVMLRV